MPVTEGFLKSDELGRGSATPHRTGVLELRADGTNENFFEHLRVEFAAQAAQDPKLTSTGSINLVDMITPRQFLVQNDT